MKLDIRQEDPLNILSSIKPVVENLDYITIHQDKISALSAIIAKKLEDGINMSQMHFGKTDNLSDSMQLIFIEDVVNFCFWAEKDKPKWQVEWPKKENPSGGWFGLTKCFQRAIEEKILVLDSNYLENIDIKKTQHLFRGINDIEIPLIEKRMDCLREAGKILNQKYSGKFINLVEAARYDAIELVKLLVNSFPLFRDKSSWKGKEVAFLKRAQICAQDISYLEEKYKTFSIKNVNLLTAFADYKIPQMLRHYGVISYNLELSEKIDNCVLIPQGSLEEIEIRSVTIWCIELIRQEIKKYAPGDIDNALWLISQDQSNIKPYHRTYTIFY